MNKNAACEHDTHLNEHPLMVQRVSETWDTSSTPKLLIFREGSNVRGLRANFALYKSIYWRSINWKLSYPCNRPWRPIGLSKDRESHILKTIGSQMAVRLLALRAGYPLPLWRFLVLISVRGRVNHGAMARLEGLGILKHSMTSSGLEPATFRLVAQCLNQLR
jgi:hypothetical protein